MEKRRVTHVLNNPVQSNNLFPTVLFAYTSTITIHVNLSYNYLYSIIYISAMSLQGSLTQIHTTFLLQDKLIFDVSSHVFSPFVV